jgi:hypothetical protein
MWREFESGPATMSDIDDQIRKSLLDALDILPGVIRSSLLEKKPGNATNTLRWTELAIRLHRGPVDRAITDIDRKNADEARQILREAIPILESMQMVHKSERLRRKAAQYLEIIAAEIDTGQYAGEAFLRQLIAAGVTTSSAAP